MINNKTFQSLKEYKTLIKLVLKLAPTQYHPLIYFVATVIKIVLNLFWQSGLVPDSWKNNAVYRWIQDTIIVVTPLDLKSGLLYVGYVVYFVLTGDIVLAYFAYCNLVFDYLIAEDSRKAY